MKRCRWIILLVLSANDCSGSKGKPADLLDIHEAVSRHQLKGVHGVEEARRSVVYVTVQGDDPAPDLLRRFDGATPTLMPGAKRNLRRTVLISISGVKWIDNDTAEVEGDHNSVGMDASRHSYRLERREGKWVVTNDTITAES